MPNIIFNITLIFIVLVWGKVFSLLDQKQRVEFELNEVYFQHASLHPDA